MNTQMIRSAVLFTILTIFCCGTLTSCGKNDNENKEADKKDITKPKTDTRPADYDEPIPWKTSTGDEIEYAIISPGKHMQHVFGNTYSESELSNEELEYAFKKIDTCFWDQRRGTVNRLLDMKPTDYKMQFICAKNAKGEKILYVNAFCKSPNNDIYTNWKENIVEVDDGGKCYWNLTLNLDNRVEHYVLKVNGHS